MRWTLRGTEDGLKHTTEEEQQKALMRSLGMIHATWRVSRRIQALSGDAVSSSTSQPHRRVKPKKPRSPTTGCPMIEQSLGELTEQFNMMTLWKNAGRKSSIVLRNGNLKIGYLLCQKEEEPRKDFNIS